MDSGPNIKPYRQMGFKMAKTFNNLYNKICEFKNLYQAYLKACRNKRYCAEVLEFSRNVGENLLTLQKELISGTYQTGRYHSFYVYDPKKRRVFALPFRDRVVQHALCNVIEPIFDKRFLADSYACRKNRGTHKAQDRLTYFLRKKEELYCLKGDIEKYFPSVDHRLLSEIIEKKIGCRKTMWLIKEIIDSVGGDKGIPIGNLTSQLFANIYLNELDYFVKQNLRCRYYLRYMDDFIILDTDKKELQRKKELIETFLNTALKLRLNKKSQIFSADGGINFLSFRIYKTHRLLKKNNIRRTKRRLKKFQCLYTQGNIGLFEIRQSLMSYLGHLSHGNCYNLRRRLLSNFVLRKG